MAKYIAQAILLGTQVLARSFFKVIRKEYVAAFQVSVKNSGKLKVETNLKMEMTLEEGRAIFNLERLNSKEISKAHEPLFLMNGKGGSLYIQSKDLHFGLVTRSYGHTLYQNRYFSKLAINDVFSNTAKERFIKSVQQLKINIGKAKTTKEAAVMVPFCRVNGKPSVLLTMRSAMLGRNKGDVSFPGGMKDISDKNAIDVALRETEEEIGLLSKVEIWTTMPSLPGTGKILVTPVVTFIGDIQLDDCKLNKDEVEYAFTVSLESLCSSKVYYYTQYKSGYVLPVFIIDKHRIWGLTAAILHYSLKMLLSADYKHNLKNKSEKLVIN